MQVRSNTLNQERGLCILSLDAGGPRAVSQLRILSKLMDRLTEGSIHPKRPCSVFDMIGGTGTAGFISILLVVFGLAADDALNEFGDFNDRVLEMHSLNTQARTKKLEEYVEDLLRRHGFTPETRLMDQNARAGGCKLVVPISYKHDAGSTCTLRNFSVRQEQTLDVTIAEALVATVATPPPLFTPAPIDKDAAAFEYISGDLALSNPTQEIISEAHGKFGPERRIACLLSLGGGHPGVIATPNNPDLTSWNTFLKQLMSSSERQARSIDSQMSNLGIYFRFSVMVGLEKKGSMDQPESTEIISHTDNYLEDVTVSQKMERCADFLKVRDGVASLEQLKFSGGERISPPVLPPLTQTFVMRNKPWEFIERRLLGTEGSKRSRMLVVTGMGGCGKTQIILKFMQVHEENFASMFFIDSSSKGRLRADIVRHVRSLGTEHSQKTFEDCLLFLAQPSPNGPRLILYDNVDDPNMELAPLLPQGKSCTIIITSRDRLIGGLCSEGHLELDVMSIDEAIELLLHMSNRSGTVTDQDRKEARDIAQELGCLPLALQQARSYMFQTKCSAVEYLERLGTSRDKLMSIALMYRLDIYSISTYAAFDASFDKLALRTRQFLKLFSFFHWVNFPLELIALGAKRNFSEYETKYVEHDEKFIMGKALLERIFFRDGKWEATNLDEIIKSIQNYSLGTLVPGVDTMLLQMHPLAHGWVHSFMAEEDRVAYRSAAILLLALGARRLHTPSGKYLSNHAAHMSKIWDQLHVNDAEAFGRILTDGGLFNEALMLRERVVAELRNQLDANSILFSDSLWLLAVSYSNVERYSEAEVLQKQVISVRKNLVQENDPVTLAASISLANTYRILRRFNDAESLQTEVLRVRRETLGVRNTETIAALNQLALTYSDSGQLEGAEELQLEGLELTKELKGERHPDTLIASGNLAQTYLKSRRPKEALELQLEVVRLSKEVRGDRHPFTSEAMSRLAFIYSALGEFHRAETLQEDVQRLSKEIRGVRHPVTISASSRLASVYYELGRFKEAETLQEDVLRLRREILGERHLDTIAATGPLATTYHRLGRSKDAEWLLEEMWRRRREVLGEHHPDTLKAAQDLAWMYKSSPTPGIKAMNLMAEVVRLTREARGNNHPDHVTAGIELELYMAAERAQRIHILKKLLLWRRQRLGERHRDTIRALMNVGNEYRNTGRPWKAEKRHREGLRLMREVSGDHDPDTVIGFFTLGITLHTLGQLQEAETLQLQALNILKETRGEHHPDAILTLGALASIYYDFGRFDEAEKLEQDMLKLRSEVLGEHLEAVLKPRIKSGWVNQFTFKGEGLFWSGVSLALRILDR